MNINTKRFFAVISAVVICLPVFGICEADNVQSYTNGLRLSIDESTLNVTVSDTVTGRSFTTNPTEYDSSVYVGDLRKDIESQLVISYADKQNNIHNMWSSEDCVPFEQFEIQKNDSEISVQMKLGEDLNNRLVPAALSEKTFENILEKLSSDFKRSKLTAFYTLYLTDELPNGESAELLKQYPYLAQNSLYIMRDDLTDVQKSTVSEYLNEAGFSTEKLIEEYKLIGISSESVSSPSFEFEIVYKIENGGLSVTIPGDSIKYDKSAYTLVNIKLLEYFSASLFSEEHNGYIMIPDGSGAIIEFEDNSENAQQKLIRQVYGFDCAVSYPDTPRFGEEYRLPVFGIKSGNEAVFAIIENGAGLAEICTCTGDSRNFYNAYAVFSHTPSETLLLEPKVSSAYSTRSTTYFANESYSGDYRIIYRFLREDDADYVGMAREYQNYLFTDGDTDVKSDNMGIFLTTLGAVDNDAQFIGISYKNTEALTTFEDNKTIISELRNSGVEILSLSLEAWRKGAFNASLPGKLDAEKILGSNRGLQSLYKWCENNSVELFPKENFVFVKNDGWFDGFSASKDAARLLNKKYAGHMTAKSDLGTYDSSSFRFALSPAKYSKFTNKFLKAFENNGIDAVALSEIGSYLNSDFGNKRTVNREQSIGIIQKILDNASKNKTLSFDGANAYVLKYADYLTDTPSFSSEYAAESYSIPFIQLVLNGKVKYSTSAINLSSDSKRLILKCAETGMFPSYTVAYENTLSLRNAGYSEYYTVKYSAWKDEIIKTWEFLKPVYEKTQGHIIEHYYVSENVTCTVWSNSARVYVNYGKTPYSSAEVTVDSESYTVV